MRRLIRSTLWLAVLAAASSGAVRAGQPAEAGKIRVLLTTGGHGFQAEPFYGMFDAMADVEYTKAELPKDAGLLKPGLEKQYDVIVMYDMCRPGISPEQQKAFVDLLKAGIGVVSLHHNLGAHQDWDEFPKIIGGKFFTKESVMGGQKHAKSTWSHDEEINVTVVNKDHPITRGVEDFQIHDETYGGYYTAPDVKVLLTTDHPKNDLELGWVKSYGNSRVFFLMLGHDGQAYGNPNYRKLVNQGIHWAAGR